MRKFLSLMLALILALSLVAVNAEALYERAEDEDIYYEVLGDYDELMQAAKAAATNDERFVLYAQAEAYLLDSAVMIPTTTQNGAYTISRIAPRTVPYVQWGNDDDRLFGLVIADEFLTPDERAVLMDAWSKAVAGEGVYDPAAIPPWDGFGDPFIEKPYCQRQQMLNWNQEAMVLSGLSITS